MLSPAEIERATRRLAASYTQRLAAEGHPNPATLANELIVMLRGHGWRPVEVLQTVAQAGKPSEPNDEWQQAKAEIAARKATR